MAIAAIYILLAFSSFLLWLGMNKEDAWIVIFAGILFLFSGFNVLLYDFQDLPHIYSQVMGIVLMFFGLYISIRSTFVLFHFLSSIS